jgi:hypothetical protein
MPLRAVVAVALVLALAGCTAARAVTEEEARAAPARLKAGMGPEGDLSGLRITVDMRMAASQDGAGTSMRMGMEVTGELFQGGAMRLTVRYTAFQVTGPSGEAAPDLSGVVVRITCLPDRWVVESEGLAQLGKDDVSVQASNTAGTCTPDRFAASEDLARAMGGLSRSLGSMASSFGSAVPSAEYAFVSLQDGGRQATYVVAGPAQGRLGMGGHNLTATFDGQARIATTRMSFDVDLQVMAMAMEVRTEYTYGSRPPAPDAQGQTSV